MDIDPIRVCNDMALLSSTHFNRSTDYAGMA